MGPQTLLGHHRKSPGTKHNRVKESSMFVFMFTFRFTITFMFMLMSKGGVSSSSIIFAHVKLHTRLRLNKNWIEDLFKRAPPSLGGGILENDSLGTGVGCRPYVTPDIPPWLRVLMSMCSSSHVLLLYWASIKLSLVWFAAYLGISSKLSLKPLREPQTARTDP